MKRVWASLLVLFLLAATAVPAAGSQQSQGTSGAATNTSRQVETSPAEALRSTPDILEAAVASGQLSQISADIYLARAFSPAGGPQIPPEYLGTKPWHGTLPLLNLHKRFAAMPPSLERRALGRAIEANNEISSCANAVVPHINVVNTANFHVTYSSIGGGLSIGDYTTALEASWTTQITDFGWASPPVRPSNPPPGNRYHVRIDAFAEPGLYGYVSPSGTHAGPVGDNPNTAWTEPDAYASCMVLNRDYSGFPGSSQRAMEATVAHEFNHSIQFGYVNLNGPRAPDDVFIEGGATWMEDEVFDSADDNYNYLYPIFTDPLADYSSSPYPYWIVFRALTEPFGTNTAGLGEDVMQAFWENISSSTSTDVAALSDALLAEGTTLGDAYHDAAIAIGFMKPCTGGYVATPCLEEGPDYVTAAGLPDVDGTIASVGDSRNASIKDDYALNWIELPASGSAYNVVLANNAGSGGELRLSVVCDTGSALTITEAPGIATSMSSVTAAAITTAGCVETVAVVTSQQQSAGNPNNPPNRSYMLLTTSADVPDAPTSADAVAGDAQATVTWTAPVDDGGAPITGYEVTSSPGDVSVSVGATPTEATVTGLTNGQEYTFTVKAENAVGFGPASAASNAVTPEKLVTVPGAPTEVTATAGNTSATVSWTAPADDGGSALTKYRVTAEPGGATKDIGSTITETSFTGLTNGQAYTFTVMAENAIGFGPESDPSDPVTPKLTTVPGVPTGVSAVAGDAAATVTWGAPSSDGGTTITGYRVTASPGGAFVDVGPTTRSTTFSGLANGTTYTFSVVAANAIGSGPGGTSNAVTPQSPPTKCDALTDVAGTTHGDTICRVVNAEVAGGFSDSTFRPTVNVSRGQMATFIANAFELPAANCSFPDIGETVHAANICKVVGAGIASGFGDGTYRPNASVTRSQMATFIANALNLAKSSSCGFPDIAGSVHAGNICAVANAGIASGFGDGTYGPNRFVTRGQMSTFIARAAGL